MRNPKKMVNKGKSNLLGVRLDSIISKIGRSDAYTTRPTRTGQCIYTIGERMQDIEYHNCRIRGN